jgi:hypothetical protein
VNDRLLQSAWLKDQLKVTKDALSAFAAVDEIRMRLDEKQGGVTVKAGVGAGLTTPRSPGSTDYGEPGNPGAAGSAPPAPGAALTAPGGGGPGDVNGLRIVPTTSDQFRAMNTYREEVRSEMMQTLLDDRHDIRGNTIYRLAFDATILAGARADNLALVDITLKHDFKEHRSDYETLYEDWLRYMQKVVSGSVDGLAATFAGRQLDPRVRMLMPYFVVQRVCESLVPAKSDAELSNRQRVCNAWAENPSPDVIRSVKIMTGFVRAYLDYRQSIVRDRFERDLEMVALKEKLDLSAFTYAFDFALRDCNPEQREIPTQKRYLPAVSSFLPPWSPNTAALAPTASVEVSTTVVQATSGQRVEVQCPLFTLSQEGVIAGLTLYEFITGNAPAFQKLLSTATSNGEPDDLVKKVLNDSTTLKCRGSRLAVCIVPDLTPAQFRCVAADYLVWSLNAFGRPDAALEQRIDSYLDLKAVGRPLQDCNLIVAAKPVGLSSAAVTRLQENLNLGNEVFAYSVTPRSLSQRLQTTTDNREALRILLSGRGVAPTVTANSDLEAQLKRVERSQAIQNHAIVVGFGRTYKDGKAEPANQTGFGWAIAPRISDSGTAHVDGQYGMAAVISVPGWWRSVTMDVETCWISRNDLRSDFDSDGSKTLKDLCTGKTRATYSPPVVRLPGTIADISRKLGFEVVQEPYLDRNQATQMLQVGQRGEILLTGGRLWRSTEVTLGAQLADRITVLPNMEGIIATFDCVRSQSSWIGAPGAVNVPVVVWTSEGMAPVTDGIQILVPQEFRAGTVRKPCPSDDERGGGPTAPPNVRPPANQVSATSSTGAPVEGARSEAPMAVPPGGRPDPVAVSPGTTAPPQSIESSKASRGGR